MRSKAELERSLEQPLDLQRRQLLRVLASGAFLVPGVALMSSCAQTFGQRPAPLPSNRSVWRAEGGFAVDGTDGSPETRVMADSVVETDDDGGLVFVVGETAMFARPGTRLRMVPDGAGLRLAAVRVERGAVLTVFPERVHRIETPLAVIGIRGTGVYAAVEETRDYVCTCYGIVDLGAKADPASTEEITSEHHDAPRYVLAAGASGTRLRPAPFRDHSDEELLLLEALVGREPPFPVTGDAYGMSRRRSY